MCKVLNQIIKRKPALFNVSDNVWLHIFGSDKNDNLCILYGIACMCGFDDAKLVNTH